MSELFFDDFMDYNNSLPDMDMFVASQETYGNEQDLYDSLLTEAYNKRGVPCEYYLSTYDTNFNKIFGEDGNRSFVRSFDVMTYYELPKEMELWSKFGIEGLDNFQMSMSKRHYSAACQDDGSDYVRPKVGDVIRAKYNNRFYEIIDVGEEEEVFLQKKHTWILTVSVFRDEHVKVSNALSADILSDYTNQSTDLFDLSATIEQKNEDIKFDDPSTQQNSIWGNW